MYNIASAVTCRTLAVVSGHFPSLCVLKYSPILWWFKKKYLQNLHTLKNFFFSKPQKILRKKTHKILNPKKWSEPTYVWEYQSPPPPPLGLIHLFGLLPGLIPFSSLWHAVWILEKNIYINMNYSYLIAMYESIFVQMQYIFLEEFFFSIFALKHFHYKKQKL